MAEDTHDTILCQLADEVRNMKMAVQGTGQHGKLCCSPRLVDKTNSRPVLTVVARSPPFVGKSLDTGEFAIEEAKRIRLSLSFPEKPALNTMIII